MHPTIENLHSLSTKQTRITSIYSESSGSSLNRELEIPSDFPPDPNRNDSFDVSKIDFSFVPIFIIRLHMLHITSLNFSLNQRKQNKQFHLKLVQ